MEIFTYEGKKLNIIKKDDDIWFRGKTVADILGYEDTKKAIFKHVDSKDKCSLKRLKSKGDDSPPLTGNTKNTISKDNCSLKRLKSKGDDSPPLTGNTKNTISKDKCSLKRLKSWGNESFPLTEVGENDQKSKGDDSPPLTRNTGNTIYINESGLYSLILRSKMDKAKEFKRWVTKEVLPSIRKTGKYEFNNRPHKMLAFNINTEYDLHKKVVNFIRNNYPKAILTASLGENQINGNIRIKSYNMGYQKGSPDLIIQNLHLNYSGFAIEFKTPTGYGKLSEEQKMMLQEYENNNYKILVSNDYDEIIKEIILYFQGVRIKCKKCPRKFKSSETLSNHSNYIHKHQ